MRYSTETFCFWTAAVDRGASTVLDVAPGWNLASRCQSNHFGGRIEKLTLRKRLGVEFADEIPRRLGIRLDHGEVGVVLTHHRRVCRRQRITGKIERLRTPIRRC